MMRDDVDKAIVKYTADGGDVPLCRGPPYTTCPDRPGLRHGTPRRLLRSVLPARVG